MYSLSNHTVFLPSVSRLLSAKTSSLNQTNAEVWDRLGTRASSHDAGTPLANLLCGISSPQGGAGGSVCLVVCVSSTRTFFASWLT